MLVEAMRSADRLIAVSEALKNNVAGKLGIGQSIGTRLPGNGKLG